MYDILGLINCNNAKLDDQDLNYDFQLSPNPCIQSIRLQTKLIESSFCEIYSQYGQFLKYRIYYKG